MADTRTCEQCGTGFAPRREHARFCSARCRVAWNREHTGERTPEASALDWSMGAMRDATGRLLRATARDRARPFAVISEAVWWVTIVDATLVRYHPDTYDAVLAGQPEPERPLIEGTLAGLRFVRNRMGQYLDPVDFIQPEPGEGPGDARITAWTWKPVPEPVLEALPSRGQEWEMTRYREYQAQLVGRTVGETFGRAAAFLELTAAASEADPPAAGDPAATASPARA
ncbi:MAG TPA: hypothetical protein VMI33_19195 [Streptosporangiaceae bacterium]|nr:hypothetical protein [Streptosporangiaceae bacterium]